MRCTSPHLVPNGVRDQKQVPEPLKTSCEIGKPKSVCSKLTRIIVLFVPHFCNSICIWTSSFWPCRRIELHKCLEVQRILQRTNLPRIVSQSHLTRTLLESYYHPTFAHTCHLDSQNWMHLLQIDLQVDTSVVCHWARFPAPGWVAAFGILFFSVINETSQNTEIAFRTHETSWNNRNVFILHATFNPPALQSSEKPELRLDLHKTSQNNQGSPLRLVEWGCRTVSCRKDPARRQHTRNLDAQACNILQPKSGWEVSSWPWTTHTITAEAWPGPPQSEEPFDNAEVLEPVTSMTCSVHQSIYA